MSYLRNENLLPLICVIDRDRKRLPSYHSSIDGLGLQLRFASSVDEIRQGLALETIAVLVHEVDSDFSDGLSLQRDLLLHGGAASVILTARHRMSEPVIEGLQLGAIALLPRPWSEIAMARYVNDAVTRYQQMQRLHGRLQSFQVVLDGLTPRQREVLKLASTGVSNKRIATEIDVSQRTVESERARLLEAFEMGSFCELMIRLGEFRALEQTEELRRRSSLERLEGHEASTRGEPFRGDGSLAVSAE